MNEEKQKRLGALMTKINKRFGPNTLMTAKQAAENGTLQRKRLETPSVEVNKALYGGLFGIVELAGNENSGKTSFAIEQIVKSQKEDKNFVAAWLETEGSVDEDILKQHGVDMERLVFWSQEDVGNAENALDISRGLVSSGDIDLLVINSIAGLTPKTEVEDDLDHQNVALVARLLSKYFRLIIGSVSKNKLVAIFINQFRDTIGGYGNPTTTTGGRALRFYASQRLEFRSVKIKAEDPIKEEEGVKINVIVKKNRGAGMNPPFTKCTYYARFNTGIDSCIGLMEAAFECGIAQKGGSWISIKDSKGEIKTFNKEEAKYQGKTNFYNAIKTNKKLYDYLIKEVSAFEAMTKEEIDEINKEQEKIEQEFSESSDTNE